MKFILDNFELLVRYAPVALGVSLFLIVLFFAVNSRSVYASLNKRTARCARRLKKPAKKRDVFQEASPVPREYYSQFECYKKSVDSYPSEFLKFSVKKQRLPLFVLNIIVLALLLAFAGLNVFYGGKLLFILAPVGLAVLFVLLSVGVRFIRKGNRAKAQKVFFNFCKLLDFYYGKDFFLDAALPDEVRNDKVDRAVSKIDFLTRNGLDKDMARKLARLLDDEELKHPRTVEQQKKLNAALNRLVQNLSSKNEKLAAQS